MAAPARILPSDVDFRHMPKAWAGQWIVIDTDTRRVLGRGDTIEAALNEARVDHGANVTDPEIAIARVPSGIAASSAAKVLAELDRETLP